jgi:cytochrome b561
MIKNTSDSYGLVAKVFHWLISLIIICLLTVGFTMTSMDPSDEKWQLYSGHKATGVIVLSLVILRFLWRLINTEVLLPASLPSWQKAAARATHYMLYFFMFMMPISGVMMCRFGGNDIDVFGMFTIHALEKNPDTAKLFWQFHTWAAIGFVALIALHILAGLYHHFIRKDRVLIRMIK